MIPPGPARWSALPEPTKSPGPMMPPMAIIWRCRDLSRRCNGASFAPLYRGSESLLTSAWEASLVATIFRSALVVTSYGGSIPGRIEKRRDDRRKQQNKIICGVRQKHGWRPFLRFASPLAPSPINEVKSHNHAIHSATDNDPVSIPDAISPQRSNRNFTSR